jgi:predicted O-methyltransferase YrrM
VFDMVFVDGDHSEDAVYRDACSAHMLIRDSGIILVHDYTDPSDDERPPWTQDVYRAVERFLSEQPGFERTRLPGWLVALQRKG